ncbi:MAG TPA: GPP34 family phosphoprotein [Mycobacterium sp.]|nr:GPP34 family phosphoprotein [Mycobacterium sp.]
MARIAEDLLLTLLDNESAQPQLQRTALGRVLAAALILDLALGCRVRPSIPGEPAPSGTLVALAGPVPIDPAVRPALAILERGPLTPAAAIATLRKRAEDDVLDQLLRTGQIHQIQLSKQRRLRRNVYAWPMHDRTRIDGIRAAILAALFGGHRPDPVTAAVVTLLTTTGALATALHLDADRAEQAAQRAGGVTFGAGADPSTTAEVNLAVTAAAVLPALG